MAKMIGFAAIEATISLVTALGRKAVEDVGIFKRIGQRSRLGFYRVGDFIGSCRLCDPRR
jgi:hypothetical protein